MQVNKEIGSLRIEDYTYDLPSEKIAFYPLNRREDSKLLVTEKDIIRESRFGSIDDFLPHGSLIILNNTRVVQARLEFFKDTGSRIEIFCLNPVSPVKDVQQALGQPSPVVWQCLIGNARKWKSGSLEITDPGSGLKLQAWKTGRSKKEFEISFAWEPSHLAFGEILQMAGKTPLPPYITRQAGPNDRKTYQTVYARHEGSVAAPTAGLHFTPEVFERLNAKQIRKYYVTLHVGAGTFKPVSSDVIGQHQMHSEQFSVERSLLQTLCSNKQPVVSVGTTSMRTLESLYWLGAMFLNGYQPAENIVKVEQWVPYNGKIQPGTKKAFEAILNWMDENKLDTLQGETALIIVPGYNFKVVDVLITNFHQPKSTLLMLVAAFAGKRWKNSYQYALDNDFRFLSYGDSCLFFRDQEEDK